MAQVGFYEDPPGRRIAYDDDGTIVIHIDTDLTSDELTTDEKQDLNSISQTKGNLLTWGNGGSGGTLVFIFPEERNITNVYMQCFTDSGVQATVSEPSYSLNTTNGYDGDWTESGTEVTIAVEAPIPNYRDGIYAVPVACRAISFPLPYVGVANVGAVGTVHLYGQISSGETPHRLEFCDSSGSRLSVDFDFGDQPRDSTNIWNTDDVYNQTTGLYLKNVSDTQAANDITVSVETLNVELEMGSDTTISDDGVTYATFIEYDEIQPQEIVGPIYVKHVLDETSVLGLREARLQVEVDSWV